MKLFAPQPSPQVLKVLITSRYTGIKLELDLNPKYNGMVLQVNRNTQLQDANTICMYLSHLQQSVSLVPEAFLGAQNAEVLEWEARQLSSHPKDPKHMDTVRTLLAQHENPFMVDVDSITLADIAVFVWMYAAGMTTENNDTSSKWMQHMLAEDHVKEALSALKVNQGSDLVL
eukprot:gb/GECH01012440.1/.p1 GENE.gb/GECH01012440.1/~~gb/GECH01012440.1/.p1  ORF type:complete len:173 (+),score=27.20 gb/GECH01012440.1/:1-519(+)